MSETYEINIVELNNRINELKCLNDKLDNRKIISVIQTSNSGYYNMEINSAINNLLETKQQMKLLIGNLIKYTENLASDIEKNENKAKSYLV